MSPVPQGDGAGHVRSNVVPEDLGVAYVTHPDTFRGVARDDVSGLGRRSADCMSRRDVHSHTRLLVSQSNGAGDVSADEVAEHGDRARGAPLKTVELDAGGADVPGAGYCAPDRVEIPGFE